MKKFLKISAGVLFIALLFGTIWFLWQKTRPVKFVYAIVQPRLDTLQQVVVATGKVEPRDEVLIKPRSRVSSPTSTRRPARRSRPAR